MERWRQGPVDEIMSRLDLHPLTGRFDAGAVISTKFASYDPVYDLGELNFPGGQIQVAGLNMKKARPCGRHIRARDVSLMTAEPRGSSVLNVFKGRISDVREEDGPQLDLSIDIGVPLIARVTRKSYDNLGLRLDPVHAMIKAVAIDRRKRGWHQGPWPITPSWFE